MVAVARIHIQPQIHSRFPPCICDFFNWFFDFLKLSFCVFLGAFQNGVFEGRGIKEYWNAKYDGEWENGKKIGQGIYETEDGDVYEGEWFDDCASGQGTLSPRPFAPLLCLRVLDLGPPSSSTLHRSLSLMVSLPLEFLILNSPGHSGKCVYGNGDIYIGEWDDSTRQGHGIYTFNDGTEIEGTLPSQPLQPGW